MFVVAHFHFMLMGVGLFGAMGGIAFYFPKMTGRMLNERSGSIGLWTAFVGFQITFISMFVAGLQGQLRRVLQFDDLFNISNWISTIGAYTIGVGMLIFLGAIISSWKYGDIAIESMGLEVTGMADPNAGAGQLRRASCGDRAPLQLRRS